ncbi:MAG TPA: DUF2911 domain-containing protein [Gemmatimonadaceae bacterium]|nr:DUF2911 domain-containing protein [Gemmatimonadaceae bacterium]
MPFVPSHRVLPRAAAICALALATGLLAAASRRGAGAETAGFIATLGRDTVAAESLSVMDDGSMTGVSVVRRAQTTLTRYYTLTLDKDGNLAKFEMASYPTGVQPGQHPAIHTIWTPQPGAMHEVIRSDSAYALDLLTPPTTLPYLDLGFGMWQAVTMRLVRSGKDSLSIPMFFVADTTHYATTVKRIGKDSVMLSSIYGVAWARIDARGQILGYAAPGSTQQVVAARLPHVDPKAWAAAFAKLPPLGQLSPTDTVRATVDGAKVMVIYGRPSMRGRIIFGGVVPWNHWWRTGANAATTLITDKDIVIGGANVPAGEYTLFTLPTPTSWTLIISKLTKEWGTDYDDKMDLVRVPMTVSALAAPVEQLTIAIAPRGAGQSLIVSWEKTAAAVTLRPK